jgi:hypothetical protein
VLTEPLMIASNPPTIADGELSSEFQVAGDIRSVVCFYTVVMLLCCQMSYSLCVYTY